ncbi:dipeptidyl peptidase 3 [Lethenteron reissneri]|uniref:dipeptidyl peptidase 3 n=1 Tax=Lethenteron reissneri TaxID=7753 RepID=UPI002AB64F1E|nr:dipeptidyl peptidase 3 [Lethenteron reissneri]
MSGSAATVDPQFILPNRVSVVPLECRAAFELLSARERQYAHYLSRAAWYGGLVVLLQTSPESPALYALLQRLFRAQGPAELGELATRLELSADEYQSFLVYAAGVYDNMGNYKSFGDTKFVPAVTKDKLEKLVLASAACEKNAEEMKALWQECSGPMYSLAPGECQLGLGTKGISSYFSGNCTMADAELVQKFLDEKSISAYNTRLFKTVASDGSVEYEVRQASIVQQDKPVEGEKENKCGQYEFEGNVFKVTRGDYSPLLSKVVENLKKAKECAANEHEVGMLAGYIDSFTYGSIDAHKRGSSHWIKDKGPIVESYIGFIESYRDPFGSRGEFEGFVAMVNKDMSAKYSRLVASAEELLPQLPWPASFEKDRFLKPDFTSLEVLTFAGSGIPAGINIPNYDDIRQSEGFKNVSLGNVLSASYQEEREKLTFMSESDKDLYVQWKGPSFEVQVGLHELLGHGSGKLFTKDEKGVLNFDVDKVVNPITEEKIKSWYKSKETWDGKFSSIASTYEECRAECVGLYLSLDLGVLRIFGHEGNAAQDVTYVNWLSMVRAGVLALEFYTPETDTWRQAHMQARFVILRVLLQAGGGLVNVEHTVGADGRPDARISLDRAKIPTVGRTAIHDFLLKLQVYKSTADVDAGRALYAALSAVNDDTELRFLALRDTVMLRKEPRKMFVQVNTALKDEEVVVTEYEGSAAGLVHSFTERFAKDGEQLEAVLLELSRRDQHHWKQQQ